MFSLLNRSVVITGGGSGIGRAIGLLFAKQGASVHILELDERNAQDTVADAKANNGKMDFHLCDVTRQKDVDTIFNQVGGIDILVNNAGIAHIGRADNTSESDFDRIINVNVKGVYNCIHAVLPVMLKKGKGVILNMASVAALVGLNDRFAYTTSKGAIIAMTLSVAKDYLKNNIRCNSISPARVHTPFVDGFIAKNYPGKEKEMFEKLSMSQPIGRMAEPDEIASLALYLCSDEASFITGCDYPIDGGYVKLNG
jgi:NAD(P)-dependent dehydrogenase (short-subunit alcohol dehydrogenase family)